MKRFSGLQYLFGLFLVLSMMLVKPFDVYAITPLSSIAKQSFEDGPWAGQTVALGRVNTNGTITNYGVPSWRDGNSSGDAYYNSVGSYSSGVDGYFFSGDSVNNVVIWSYGPLDELYVVDSAGTIVANVLEDAFLVNPSSSRYFYGVSLSGGAGVAFSSSAMVYLTELSTAFNGGLYYEQIVDAMPYLGGIYDANSVAVKYPGLLLYGVVPYSLSYGFNYFYFPVVCMGDGDAQDVFYFQLNSADGLFHNGSSYNFNFKQSNIVSSWVYYNSSNSYGEWQADSSVLLSFAGVESSVSSATFYFQRYSDVYDAICLIYKTSWSDDIGTLPPDDSGNGEGSGSPNYSSALSQIGNLLEEVMSAVSEGSQQIVNNITYQTTQITNTITNTVTNMTQQITQGLSDVKQGITDKLQGVQEGLSNKLEDVKSGVNEKLGQVQEGINNKLGEVQEELVNGYDNSGINQDADELDQSLQEYEEAEQNVLDQVNDSLNDFEFDSGFEEYTNTIKVFSDFLQALYESSGGFKVVINLSLMLSIAGIVIGVYRFKEGG